ncbi:MAG: hypothetical protein ACKVWV_04950 [Planctomycetota bacterium]
MLCRLLMLVIALVASRTALRAQCATWETGPGNPGLNAPVWSLVSFDDGSGPSLFAGGTFTTAGGAPIGFVGRWDGVAWHDLAGGMNGPVFSLCVYDDGNGPALYAGGRFSLAGNVAASSIAKWDGTNWSALGAGVVGCNFASCRVVLAMATHDDGSGNALFVAGDFNTAGGVPASRIAKWQTSAWTTLGSGLDANVNALTVFDDGSGSALYAGGAFTNAGGVSASRVARWRGGAWSSLGSEFGTSPSSRVNTLTVFDDGAGSALYAGGAFAFTVAGQSIRLVAKWGGTSWSPVGLLSGTQAGAAVNALRVFDDGHGGGPALYAGGTFVEPFPSQGSQHTARWTGTNWMPLGFGMHGVFDGIMQPAVLALGVHDDGFGSRLYAGGHFRVAGTIGARKLASWGRCNPIGTPFCFGDGSLPTPCPCLPPNTVPNPSGGSDGGCANSFHLDGGRIRANGRTNPDRVQLIASNLPPGNSFGVFFGGDAVIAGGFAYGDGVRCADGTFVRFGGQESLGATMYYPNGFKGIMLPLSIVSGVVPGSAVTRYYQCAYRNPVFNFCSASLYNMTDAVEIVW